MEISNKSRTHLLLERGASLGEHILDRLLNLRHVGRAVLDAGWQIETMFLDDVLSRIFRRMNSVQGKRTYHDMLDRNIAPVHPELGREEYGNSVALDIELRYSNQIQIKVGGK
jgi:hypothetical protein